MRDSADDDMLLCLHSTGRPHCFANQYPIFRGSQSWSGLCRLSELSLHSYLVFCSKFIYL